MGAEDIRRGLSVSRGIAIGKPYLFSFHEMPLPEFSLTDDAIDREVERYYQALVEVSSQISEIQEKLLEEKLVEGAMIIDAQLEMLQDPLLTEEVERGIRKEKKNAESIFASIVRKTKNRFLSLRDPFFRERFKDIQDISHRVLSGLMKSLLVSLADFPKGAIVFSKELSLSLAAEADGKRVGGFVTEEGGTTSHAAIVLRGKGIPYVTGISLDKVEEASLAIIDAKVGEVILNPKPETVERYEHEKRRLELHLKKLINERELPVEAENGIKIALRANIDSPMEVPFAIEMGGDGVGLLRTEYLFRHFSAFDDRKEQVKVYKEMVEAIRGRPFIIRTFDFCQDKSHFSPRLNASFGSFARGFRAVLDERRVFRTQVAAILEATRWGDLKLLFPMVASLDELLEAKEIVKELKKEVGITKKVDIGCMIEVPSAAVIADHLAKECDFLSIGTNDLVQYTLALNRKEAGRKDLEITVDPSILRLIQYVVRQAKEQGARVSVCGEMAADPRSALLLVGLGVRELSCAPRMIPQVKAALRRVGLRETEELVNEVLSLGSGTKIGAVLREAYKRWMPDDCVFAGSCF